MVHEIKLYIILYKLGAGQSQTLARPAAPLAACVQQLACSTTFIVTLTPFAKCH